MTKQRLFVDVWKEIQETFKERETVETICQKSKNDVIEVTSEFITVRSHNPKGGKPIGDNRKLTKEHFHYVWDTVERENKVYLDDLTKFVGKRAVICAILSELPYYQGECESRRMVLKKIV